MAGGINLLLMIIGGLDIRIAKYILDGKDILIISLFC